MTIYIAIGILLFLCALVETAVYKNFINRKSINAVLFSFLTVFAIFFIGFRENCGFDYYNYNYIFDEFSTDFWVQNAVLMGVEFGYAFINHYLPDFRTVLVLMALFTVFFQFKFIYKYSPLPFLSVFLLLGVAFYPSLMGQYRQALAISIICWAFVNRDNKAFFFTLVVIAALFHTSALLSVFVLFIPDRIFKTKQYLLMLFFALVVNFSMKSVFLNFAQFLPSIISSKSEIYGESENFTLGLNFAMLIRIIVFFMIYSNKELLLSLDNFKYFLNIYFVSLLVYLGFGFLPQLSGRGSTYFYMLEFILVPMLILKTTGVKKWLFFIFFISISCYRQYTFFVDWYDDYIPYNNIIIAFLNL